jgi:hypothetical protein
VRKSTGGAPQPHWDRLRRELRYRDKLVRRYRRHAPQQMAILDAFELAGWPERIENPLQGLSHTSPACGSMAFWPT